MSKLTAIVICLAALPPLALRADQQPNEVSRWPDKLRARKLFQRVSFKGVDDPKVTLHELLQQVSRDYDLPISVNEKAFKFENVMDVLKYQVADPNPLPAAENVRLDLLLQSIIKGIPAPSEARFLLRPNAVEITTGQFVHAEVWGDGYKGPILPLVHLDVDDQPFLEVMREIRERVGVNILIDRRVGEAGRRRVSADLRNVPLDTAIALLCDSVECRPIAVNNVIYVTPRTNAAAWESWIRQDILTRAVKDPTDQSDPQAVGEGRFQKVIAIPAYRPRP
jgi:hypothetical protein